MKPSVVKLLSIFLFFFILVTTNQSCKKLKDDIQVKNEIQIVKHPLEDQFFTIADSVPDIVKKIAAYIKSRKNKSEIAANILAEVGLPVWDKSLLIMPSNAVNQKTNRNAGTSIDSSYIFVPVVTIGTKEVEGALACLVVGDSVTIKFLKEKDYSQYGFDAKNPKNAESLVGLMMYLQNKAYGTTSFVVNDERLIYGDAPYADSTQKALIHFEAVSNTLNRESKNKTAIAALYAEVQVCYAYDYYGCSNPAHWGQVCGELDKIGYHTINRCQSYTIWLGSGGSDTYNPPTSGGGTSGSVSTQTYLKQILGLTDQEAVIFESYPGLGDETYNYCNNSDGQFTELERKKLAISHTLLLGTNPEYTDYCAMRYEENASLKGKKFPWFRMLSLQDEYPDLASNIQLLKLNAQQAYYFWNNAAINLQIKQFLDANNYSESSVFRAKSAIGFALLGNLFEDPATLLVDEIVDDAITNPCLRKVLDKIQLPRFVNYASNLMRELDRSTQFKIALLQMDGTSSQTYAYTNKLFDNTFLINLDIINLPKCSQEFITAAIFHEFIHVEILSNPNWDNTNSQHQLMVTNYMNKLVTSIRNIFPSLPLKDAYAIVYGGFTPELRLTPEQKNKFLEVQQIVVNKIFEIFPSITISELDSIFLDYDQLGTKGNRSSNCN